MGINKYYKVKKELESGAASIFVVIFFTLLIGVITVSFVRITNNDQQQALNNDLSQSAYDAAQAGVEDAKRKLDECLKDSECKEQLDSGTKFNGSGCKDGADPSNNEVQVEQGPGDLKLNQAYTCVNVTYRTNDYEQSLSASGTDIIPLVSAEEFNNIDVSWFTKEDAGLSPNNANDDVKFFSADKKLPQSSGEGSNQWNKSTPALLKIQLIAISKDPSNITLQNINNQAKSVFLYPQKNLDPGAISTLSFSNPSRSTVDADGGDPYTAVGDISNQPVGIKCNEKYTEEYTCSTTLTGLNSGANNYYLLVSPLYSPVTTFRLNLTTTTGGTVLFDGVQPKIDSTGKTEDVFRRVQSRIRFDKASGGGLGFDSREDICKAFGLTHNNFIDRSDCQTRP